MLIINLPPKVMLQITIYFIALTACATAGADSGAMKPFSTDGCSLFPDHSLISKSDWYSCCVTHDLAYWRGGASEIRLKADQELKACVQHATNNDALAELMFAGVRAGGGPYLFTSYRWAYGWPFGRTYEPLTPEEDSQASSLEQEYLVKNPSLFCVNNNSSCKQ